MATITCLSVEVINIILCDESISFKDIISFALTCKQFYNLTNNNAFLWRKKFYQRWPYLREEYDELCKENTDVFEHVKAGIKSKQELWHYMSLMPEKYYHKDDLMDIELKDFSSLFDSDKGAYFMNYFFFINELMKLLAQSSIESDLTQRYYAKKLLSYMHHYHLRKKWYKFINYPEKQQILEKPATILAQWFQSQEYVSYSYVKTSLDNIAQQVLEHLKNEYPTHPIFSISAEQFSFWRYNNIDDNHWNSIDGKWIMESLCKVLYDKLGFHGNLKEPCGTRSILEHTFIDCVLKNKSGIAITLATIYHSVARRLGIRCDLMSFPTHFFLCWKAKYNTTDFKDKECFYIDVLHNGSMRSRNDCPVIKDALIKGVTECPMPKLEKYKEISAVEMMSRMSNYLYTETNSGNDEDKITRHSFLEFLCLIKPDTTTIDELARLYIQHQADLSDFIVMLEKIQDNCKLTNPVEAISATGLLYSIRRLVMARLRNEQSCAPFCNKIPKPRTTEKFAVGMIVMFTNEREEHVGVIIAWDKSYEEYKEFYSRFTIYSCLFHSAFLSQPSYMILCENGKMYYIIEENIKLCTKSVQINHRHIGRYFCKFEHSYYVPNKALAKRYPYDKPNSCIS